MPKFLNKFPEPFFYDYLKVHKDEGRARCPLVEEQACLRACACAWRNEKFTDVAGTAHSMHLALALALGESNKNEIGI